MIPTIIEQMSSTKDKKPTKPRSQFSGMTPSQIRKYHESQVDKETFKQYRVFCKDRLELIRNAPDDYNKAYDITLSSIFLVIVFVSILVSSIFFRQTK